MNRQLFILGAGCNPGTRNDLSKAVLFLAKSVGTEVRLTRYTYNSGKVNHTYANDVHRLPSVKDAMMIPMSSEAFDQHLAEPLKSSFFAICDSAEEENNNCSY